MDAIKRVLAFCLVFQVCLFSSVAQRVRLYPQNDTLFYTKKKPLLAIGEVLVINMGYGPMIVTSLNRILLKSTGALLNRIFVKVLSGMTM